MTKILNTIFFCMLALPVYADAYLDMLEAESADLKLDQSGQLDKVDTKPKFQNKPFESVVETDWDALDLGDGLPAELKQKELESFLKSEYMGTFMFYNKLNSIDRETVYKKYTSGQLKNIEDVRQSVITLIR